MLAAPSTAAMLPSVAAPPPDVVMWTPSTSTVAVGSASTIMLVTGDGVERSPQVPAGALRTSAHAVAARDAAEIVDPVIVIDAFGLAVRQIAVGIGAPRTGIVAHGLPDWESIALSTMLPLVVIEAPELMTITSPSTVR